MKKRILSALLALAMVSTCLVGCGGNKSSESKSSGKVTKITDDTKICNMEMSPDGEWILLNYRSKGYWSALNLKTGKETKQPGISGYAHNEEICFIGK